VGMPTESLVPRRNSKKRELATLSSEALPTRPLEMVSQIRLSGVGRVYHDGGTLSHAVRDISLSIESGEAIAVMGPSGSGKSTLMHILGCLDRPSSGSYILEGVDVSSLSRDQLADVRNKTLGFIFQGFNLLSRATTLENVELPILCGQNEVSWTNARARAMECLEKVGLARRANHFPRQLSGGQQQRVAIARALANGPRIVLADEPTGNLDSKTSIEIMEIFQHLNHDGITTVVVTHDPHVARFCRRILLISDGRIVGDQPIADSMDAREEMQRIQRSETHARIALTTRSSDLLSK
jgi:putative ABC transport system ATP-binding protein